MLPSGTLTLLFTDIEGSTRLWDEHPEAMAAALQTHGEILRSAIEGNGGTVVKDKGDGFFAVFPHPGEALAATLTAQRALQEQAWEGLGAPMRVRMALHTGPLSPIDGDYHGRDVNRVARIEDAAHGGQVVLSAATAALVTPDLPDGVTLRDLGRHQLKGVADLEQVFQVVAADLDDTFPPLRTSTAGVPLPSFPTRFVGRDAEVSDIAEMLRQGERIVTLRGPGGIGKTRLAVAAAEQVADSFPGGVYFADLAAVEEPDDVPWALGRALGAQADRATLVGMISGQVSEPTLLLVDNFEQVLPAAQFVGELQQGVPALALLVTSRAPLQLGAERIVAVHPIASTDAVVELFIDRAAGHGVTLDDSERTRRAIRSIGERLGNLPLAIELAAARTRALDVVDLERRLARSLDAIGAGGADAPERQRTLAATIEWSLDSLDEPTQRLFARLAALPAGATLDMAEEVCAAGLGGDALEMLTTLVDNSLVVARRHPSGTRYRQHAVLREYGLERLGDEVSTVLGRLLDYYVAVSQVWAELMVTGELTDQDLELDHPNFAACMEHSVATARRQDVIDTMFALWMYWFNGDHIADAIPWLTAADRDIDSPRLDWLLGLMAFQTADFESAAGSIAAALEGFEASDDHEGAALARMFLGAMAEDPQEGIDTLEASIEELGAAGSTLGQYVAAIFLSVQQVAAGRLDDALSVRRELIREGESGGPAVLAAWGHWNLALVLLALDELDEADKHNRMAFEHMASIRYQEGIASTIEVTAAIDAMRGDLQRAAKLRGASETIWQRLGTAPWGEVAPFVARGEELGRQGLGDERYDELFAQGQALNLDEVIELASD